jgi:hypothetical protein
LIGWCSLGAADHGQSYFRTESDREFAWNYVFDPFRAKQAPHGFHVGSKNSVLIAQLKARSSPAALDFLRAHNLSFVTRGSIQVFSIMNPWSQKGGRLRVDEIIVKPDNALHYNSVAYLLERSGYFGRVRPGEQREEGGDDSKRDYFEVPNIEYFLPGVRDPRPDDFRESAKTICETFYGQRFPSAKVSAGHFDDTGFGQVEVTNLRGAVTGRAAHWEQVTHTFEFIPRFMREAWCLVISTHGWHSEAISASEPPQTYFRENPFADDDKRVRLFNNELRDAAKTFFRARYDRSKTKK